MRLLIIEDEEALADAIARGLRKQGWATDIALNGRDGLEKALVNEYDVVILDRYLPGLHGDEVCRRLTQEETPARILMLTAAGSVRDRVEGLDLGADDYLGKPFSFDELLARFVHSDDVPRRRGRPCCAAPASSSIRRPGERPATERSCS